MTYELGHRAKSSQMKIRSQTKIRSDENPVKDENPVTDENPVRAKSGYGKPVMETIERIIMLLNMIKI